MFKLDKNPLPISVIIPTLNRGDLLVQTIQDLLCQDPHPLEIIIVDQTPEYSSEIEAKITQLVKQNNIIYERINQKSASVARNHGIIKAKGDILLFLDDDIRAPENLCLNHFLNYLPPHNYDGVAGCSPLPNQELVELFPPEYYLPVVGWMFRPMAYANRIESFDLPTCNASIKRSIALSVGGFDENMKRMEDTDFSYRIHIHGAKIIYDPEAKITHLLAPTGAVRDIFKPLNQFVLSKREIWTELFYLVLKNFGIWGGFPILKYWIRRHITRKVLLLHPYYLYIALKELVYGYLMAKERLHKGCKYISSDLLNQQILQSKNN
jgi:glycosyltransferase involved in cell wall biosynthesis